MKAREVLEELKGVPGLRDLDAAQEAATMLERYLALADELDSDAQFIEDTLVDTDGAVWRRDVAKRLREIAEGRE